MISRELVNKMLNVNFSSRTIDIILKCSTNTDWEGNIHLTSSEIAEACNSKTRYIGKALHKLTTPFYGSIMQRTKKGNGTYTFKFLIGINKRLPFIKSKLYMKSFNLFYTPEFINADVHTKRLLVLACYKLSTNGPFDQIFILKKLKSSYLCFKDLTKKQLSDSIEYINNSGLSKYVSASFSLESSKIVFKFEDFVLDDYMSNFTINKVIRNAAFDAGYYFEVSDAACETIAKQIKSVYNKFYYYHKSPYFAKRFSTDSALDLAESLYKKGLFELFSTVANNYSKAQDYLGLGLNTDIEAIEDEEKRKELQEIFNGNKIAAIFEGVLKNVCVEYASKLSAKAVRLENTREKYMDIQREATHYQAEETARERKNEIDEEILATKEFLKNEVIKLESAVNLLSEFALNKEIEKSTKLYEDYHNTIKKIASNKEAKKFHQNLKGKIVAIKKKIDDKKSVAFEHLSDHLAKLKSYADFNVIDSAKKFMDTHFFTNEDIVIEHINELEIVQR